LTSSLSGQRSIHGHEQITKADGAAIEEIDGSERVYRAISGRAFAAPGLTYPLGSMISANLPNGALRASRRRQTTLTISMRTASSFLPG
jgi:hypothetical protein